MSTFAIRIERAEAVPGAPLAYYVHVQVDSGLAGVTASNAAPADTQALAVRAVRQQLAGVSAVDEITYRGIRYATLQGAIDAIETDRPNWV